jgi:hypothetical protein
MYITGLRHFRDVKHTFNNSLNSCSHAQWSHSLPRFRRAQHRNVAASKKLGGQEKLGVSKKLGGLKKLGGHEKLGVSKKLGGLKKLDGQEKLGVSKKLGGHEKLMKFASAKKLSIKLGTIR